MTRVIRTQNLVATIKAGIPVVTTRHEINILWSVFGPRPQMPKGMSSELNQIQDVLLREIANLS